MFKDFLEMLGWIFIFMFALFIFIFILVLLCQPICYILNKSQCEVLVENKPVYSGRCHFVDVESIGENGNTKKLHIYKDVFKMKTVKTIINNDIKVKEEE